MFWKCTELLIYTVLHASVYVLPVILEYAVASWQSQKIALSLVDLAHGKSLLGEESLHTGYDHED